MTWDHFIYFAIPACLCWTAGAWMAYRTDRSKQTMAFTITGLLIFSAFIAGLWISLERPPLRMMGKPVYGTHFFFLWQV